MVRTDHAASAAEWSIRAMRRRPPRSYVRPMPTTTTTDRRATGHGASTAASRRSTAGEGFFADDAFFDLYPPFWRFQLQGPDAFGAQLRAIAEGTSPTVRILRVVPTATGFVTEHEEVHARREIARRLILCEVRDGRITEVVVYCNGGWDADAARPPRRRGADAAAVGDGAMSAVDDRTMTAADVLAAVPSTGPVDPAGPARSRRHGAARRPARRAQGRRRASGWSCRRATAGIGADLADGDAGVRGARPRRRVDRLDRDDRRRVVDRPRRAAPGDVRRALRRRTRRHHRRRDQPERLDRGRRRRLPRDRPVGLRQRLRARRLDLRQLHRGRRRRRARSCASPCSRPTEVVIEDTWHVSGLARDRQPPLPRRRRRRPRRADLRVARRRAVHRRADRAHPAAAR